MKLKRLLVPLLLAAALLLSGLPALAENDSGQTLLRQDHAVYLRGGGDGTFRPGDSLTRAEGCTVLYNLLADQSRGDARGDFSDVSASDWYAEAVAVLASRGLLTGQGGAFRPNEPMTRGELVLMLSRAFPAGGNETCSFTDVAPGDALYPAVALAYSRGWVNGFDDGSFRPGEPLTRAQTAAIFNRVLGRSADPRVISAGSARSFSDVNPGDWFFADVLEASVPHQAVRDESGETWTAYQHTYTLRFHVSGSTTTLVLSDGESPTGLPTHGSDGRMIARWVTADGRDADPAGAPVSASGDYYAVFALEFTTDHRQYVFGYDDGSFRPDEGVTRAQVCQMLYLQLESTERGELPVSIPDVSADAWYAPAVTLLASHGVVPASGSFRPNDVMTRGELAEVLSRISYGGSGSVSFSDVSADHPQYRGIISAAARGWIEGYADGSFRPGAPASRAVTVAAINRLLNRRCDKVSAAEADERYTFTDVPHSHWAYEDILEASTNHWCSSVTEAGETWSRYWHNERAAEPWEHSIDVVRYSTITNEIGCDYLGNFSHDYNMDYSTGRKEAYVNEKGYSSETDYLLWVSRQNQKVYLFTGTQGDWHLMTSWVVCTGAPGSQTTTGTYMTISHASQLQSDHYTAWYVTNLLAIPSNFFDGFAFHSRLHRPWSHETDTWYDGTIGEPRSGGCIRMFDEDALFIQVCLPLFTTVVVY